MRKRIAVILMALALILPLSFVFSACGKEDAKVKSFSVELVNSSYTMTENTITIPYGGKVSLGSEDFKVTATLEDDKTAVISAKTAEKAGYEIASTIPDDAKTPIGEYTLTFSHADTEHKVVITIKVVKGNVDMTGVAWNYTSPYTYNKQDRTVGVTGLPSGVSVNYSGVRTAKNFGEYTVTASFTHEDAENYNPIQDMVLTWRIEKATIEMSDVTLAGYTYSGTKKEAAISSTLPADVTANITGEDEGTDAGDYDVTISFTYNGSDSANYNPIAPVNKTWSIIKAPLTVTAKDKNLTYGESVGVASLEDVNITGFVNGETSSVLGGALVLDYQNYQTIKNAESYDITPSGLTSSNYQINFVKGELVVAKKALTITADDKSVTYGDAFNLKDVTIVGFVYDEDVTNLGGTLVFNNGGYEVGSPVGEYTLTPSGLTSSNYEIEFETGTLTVGKKDLTLKPIDVHISYLEDAMNNGVLPTGLIAGDTVASLGTVNFSYGGYEAGSGVDEYEITITSITPIANTKMGNYNITFETGTLYVSPIDVPVDVSGIELVNTSTTYNGTDQTALILVNEGSVPADVTVVNAEVRDKTVINADTYTVVISLRYVDEDNYNPMDDITREFVINKATVTGFEGVSLTNNTFVYTGLNQEITEGMIQNIPTGAMFDSFVSGETAKNVDDYTVRVKLVCADTTNYVNFGERVVDLSWEITPETLTLTANDHEITYKDDPSNAGYTLTGFVTGETESTALDGEVLFSYTYTKGDNANGEYYIIPRFEGDLGNYQILNETIVKGTLTVNPMIVNVETFEWVNAGEHTYTGDEIVVSLDTKNAEGVSVGEVVITKGGEPVTEIVDAGTYTISVTISALNANYTLSINEIEDATVIVNPKPVDMTNVAWTTELTKTYDGSAFAPEIIGLPTEGITLTRNYFTGSGMVAVPFEGGVPTNAGLYSVVANITAENANYVLTNYETPIGGVEFEIEKAEIDITDVDWEDDAFAYENTGLAIKPVLNVTEIENATITYKHQQWQVIDDGDGGSYEDWVEVEPIQNGEYNAVAELVYDQDNYQLMNDGEPWGNIFLKDYRIVTGILDINDCNIAWNIETQLNNKEPYGEWREAVVAYEDEDITLNLTGNFDKLTVCYQVNSESNLDSVVITELGSYDIYAYVNVSDEYANDYYIESYSINLYLKAVVNPFLAITINDEPMDFVEFVYTDCFEFMDNISFTLKEGYSLYNSNEEPISSLVINGNVGGIKVYSGDPAMGEVVFEKTYFNYIYMDRINVNGKDYSGNNIHYIEFMLDENQNSFNIDFDDKYLTKYGTNLTYEYELYNEHEGWTTNRGVISTVPLEIQDATKINSLKIYYSVDEETNYRISEIYVQQFSPIEDIEYEYVETLTSGVHTNSILHGNHIGLSNCAILTNIFVTLREEYKDYTVLYLDSEGQPVDLTDLNNLTEINIVIKNGETIVEERYIFVRFSCSNGVQEFDNSSSNKTYFVNTNSISANITNNNSLLDVSSSFNGAETLELTEDVTNSTFMLSVVYNGQTYRFTKDVTLIKTLTVYDTVSEETYQNGVYITNTKTSENYSVSTDGSTSLLNKYTAKNLREFKNELEYLTYPAKAGLTVTNKELVNIRSVPYLKLTFSGEGLEVNTLLIKIEIYGQYDSNTDAYFNIYSGPSEPVLREPVNDIIEIDLSTERLHVRLENNNASAVLVDTSTSPETVIKTTTENGYFDSSVSFIKFKAGDHYKLIVTAADGTVKEYTIKLTGEYIPVLEVTIGDTVLVQETDPETNMPDNGPFEFIPMSETEMQFRGVGGAKLLSQVETIKQDKYLTITSLRSSMISGATIYNQDHQLIQNLNNFKLKVLGGEGSEYVTFYALAGPVKSTIVIYLSDELPLPEVLRLGYKGETYVQYYTDDGPGEGDFKVVMDPTTMTYHFYYYLPALEGEDALLENITLDDFYCMYNVVWYDGIKGEQLTSYSLKLGTFGTETVPCITAMGQLEVEEDMTITIRVTLYFGEEPEVNYPASVQVGDKSYDFQLVLPFTDCGKAKMGEDGIELYVEADPTTLTHITITLAEEFSDYSYVVITDENEIQTLMSVIMSGAQNADALNALISEGKAYRATEENELTMTIPVTMVDGATCVYIACEGFLGYIPETDEFGVSFCPVMIYATPGEVVE